MAKDRRTKNVTRYTYHTGKPHLQKRHYPAPREDKQIKHMLQRSASN